MSFKDVLGRLSEAAGDDAAGSAGGAVGEEGRGAGEGQGGVGHVQKPRSGGGVLQGFGEPSGIRQVDDTLGAVLDDGAVDGAVAAEDMPVAMVDERAVRLVEFEIARDDGLFGCVEAFQRRARLPP